MVQLLTEHEVSRMLNISVKTLQKHRVYGKGIKFLKFGRSVRYRLEDIENFINENLFQSTTAVGEGN